MFQYLFLFHPSCSKNNFLCNCNPGALVESFFHALEGLATQSKAEMRLKFLEIETNVKSTLNQFFFALNQRRCRKEAVLEFEDGCIEAEEEEQDVSTQFLQTKKYYFCDLQNHLEKYCTVLSSLWFQQRKIRH